MQLLLPPSETKRSGGGGVFAPETLSNHSVLAAARARIRASLVELSSDADAAAQALKLGAKSRGEIAHNLALERSGTLPAIERYTGVLYDAVDVPSLPTEARAWIDAHVIVQSALFGQVAAADRIPAYRLSAGSRLPQLNTPLKRVWREAHAEIDWTRRGWALDLRSKDYVELAPLPAGAGVFLHVAQRSAAGRVRALNHFNKAAKGDLVRRLALSGSEITGTKDFLAWADGAGLEILPGPGDAELTLVTALGAPGSAPRPAAAAAR